MTRVTRGFALLFLVAATEAAATDYSVTIVNQTGATLSAISYRPPGGAWASIAPGLSPGARAPARASGDGCAFDLRAEVAGAGTVVWRDINFCETRTLTLNRRADGTAWVDYD